MEGHRARHKTRAWLVVVKKKQCSEEEYCSISRNESGSENDGSGAEKKTEEEEEEEGEEWGPLCGDVGGEHHVKYLFHGGTHVDTCR